MLNKRRVIMMLGAFVLGLIFCSFATAEVFSSYQAARAATVKNKKPLVVLITASWCPPCKAFKKNILPGLYSSDAFKNVNFVHMDVDMDPMARQIDLTCHRIHVDIHVDEVDIFKSVRAV